MIIGLSGKAASGKSTIADILVGSHCFEEISLADPMKRFCEKMFAFSHEQLWGSSSSRNAPDKRYPKGPKTFVYPNTPKGAVWFPLGGKSESFTLIDAEDFVEVSKFSWGLNKKEAGKKTDYVRGGVNGTEVKLHRFLMGSIPEGMVVDHINGDGLDNRRSNLRVCTQQDNRRNESKKAVYRAASPFKGVSWDKDRSKWAAKISYNGTTRNLGRFDEEVQAALAYDEVAKQVFGKFARCNSDLFLSPRMALQTLGCEWGRAMYENLWVDFAMRDARERLSVYASSGVVISDVRFKNERDAIQKAGGKVWRIIRDGAGLSGETSAHASENDLTDDMPYDKVLNNHGGSLKDLEILVGKAIGGKL